MTSTQPNKTKTNFRWDSGGTEHGRSIPRFSMAAATAVTLELHRIWMCYTRK